MQQTRRLVLTLACVAPMLVVPLPAASEDDAQFSVQIGAFREPNETFAQAAKPIGRVYTSKSGTGYLRYQVGRYASRSEAEAARQKLASAGYTEAYVVKKVPLSAARAASQTAATAAPPTARMPAVSASAPADDPLAGVPESLRDRVVFLDGRLHVVEGERFIPLSEYGVAP